jgi:hypothetical protein
MPHSNPLVQPPECDIPAGQDDEAATDRARQVPGNHLREQARAHRGRGARRAPRSLETLCDPVADQLDLFPVQQPGGAA